MEEPEEEAQAPARAHAAVMPGRKNAAQLDAMMEIEPFEMEVPAIEPQEEEDVLEHAQTVPDEYAYPGMRYDSKAQGEMDSTQRYGAVTQEGPGAAEVQRRRGEIEAWQLQMQEEARARAEAERAQREAEEAERLRLDEEERIRRERAEIEQKEKEENIAKLQMMWNPQEYLRGKIETLLSDLASSQEDLFIRHSWMHMISAMSTKCTIC